MEYKVNTLEKFASDKAVVFDPPKKMLCWDLADIVGDGNIHTVYAYIPAAKYPVKTSSNNLKNCAEIPEQLKSRRATNRELIKWLAQGNGMLNYNLSLTVQTSVVCEKAALGKECEVCWRVCKWDDKEWHEPTADYMGLED